MGGINVILSRRLIMVGKRIGIVRKENNDDDRK
jgi:hypothetical protein